MWSLLPKRVQKVFGLNAFKMFWSLGPSLLRCSRGPAGSKFISCAFHFHVQALCQRAIGEPLGGWSPVHFLPSSVSATEDSCCSSSSQSLSVVPVTRPPSADDIRDELSSSALQREELRGTRRPTPQWPSSGAPSWRTSSWVGLSRPHEGT